MTASVVHATDQMMHIIGISGYFKVDCVVEGCRAKSTISPAWLALLRLYVNILGCIGLETAHCFHSGLLLLTFISGRLEPRLPLFYVCFLEAWWS